MLSAAAGDAAPVMANAAAMSAAPVTRPILMFPSGRSYGLAMTTRNPAIQSAQAGRRGADVCTADATSDRAPSGVGANHPRRVLGDRAWGDRLLRVLRGAGSDQARRGRRRVDRGRGPVRALARTSLEPVAPRA